MEYLLLTLILLINLIFASGQLEENEVDYFGCEQHTTCNTCLNEDIPCKWCADENYHSSLGVACSSEERLLQHNCPSNSIISLRKSKIELVDDKSFSDIVDEENMEAIQIKPQKLAISFSPFEQQNFSFHYRPAKDVSLDLYFLMDLTWSMKDDKETLVNFKENLGRELKNITKNFRLALGTFADKPLMPYASMEERRRENPCLVEQEKCERTYDFRHRLNFSKVPQFVEAVNASEMTGNLDNAEGGMDALMQVLVCGDRIGWNPNSRKIVIFATDGLSHFAGDGLLGGVVKPNDKTCHLDADGYYEYSEMDYPSLEQMSRVLREQKISVIFAATKDVASYYEQIKNLLPENTFVGRLESDSSNILALIKRGYDYIASVVNFEVPIDDDIEFVISSNCSDGSCQSGQSCKCTDVELGEVYSFTVNMNAKRKSVLKNNKTIVIRETQLGLEMLTVEIDTVTACNCIKSESVCPINSERDCGKCVCNPGWSGKNCSCNENIEGNFKNTDGCRPSNNKMGPACSGNGDCFCDKCQCDQYWTGKYCECETCPINTDNRRVCGGKNRGTCRCGVCACRKGWSGSTCSCSDTLCTSPWNNDICSGNGVCKCGKCKCIEKQGKNYTGRYCETCSNCNNPACSLYETCVYNELKLHLSPNEPCYSQDGTIFIPKKEFVLLPETSDEEKCVIKIDDEHSNDNGCYYIFTYKVLKDWNTELSIYPIICPLRFQAANILSLGVIIAVAVVILGLVLWKICDNISYNREFRKFQVQKKKEMQMASSGGNPLYRSPISTFMVPENYYGKHIE